MSGSRPRHLQRRQGTYHLRVRVPGGLVARVGLREVRRSLNAHTLDAARPLALKYAARVMDAFQMLHTTNLSGQEARALIQRCFHDLADQVSGGFTPRSLEPELERADQLRLWDDHAQDVSSQLDQHAFRHPVTGIAQHAAADAGLRWEDLSQTSKAQLLTGAARALLEQRRLFEFRMGDLLMPYVPVDSLFAEQPMRAPAGARAAQSADLGPTLGEVGQRYLEHGRRTWTAKTLRSRRQRIDMLADHLGADRPITSITAADIRGYGDAVLRLRRNHIRDGGSLVSRQTENVDHRIAPRTATLIFETTKAFFHWAKSKQGFIAVNPAEDVSLPAPSSPKRKRSRRPFSADELETLFSAPLFTGCHSAARRHDRGTEIIKDDRYWIPLLGFFTGARLGEIVQLRMDDVRTDGPIPYISINEDDDGGGEEVERKSVKSIAGVRNVPLHPDLMRLGFRDFVIQRRSDKRRWQRLFWQTSYGADGQASTVFSKWFARFLSNVGLKDPGLVFHSLRHNAEDSFRNALLPQTVIDRIIGHADQAVSAQYGEGLWLETAYEAIRAMRLRVEVVKLIAR